MQGARLLGNVGGCKVEKLNSWEMNQLHFKHMVCKDRSERLPHRPHDTNFPNSIFLRFSYLSPQARLEIPLCKRLKYIQNNRTTAHTWN